ncbi:MAG: N,N-dimethylformamidase beta subunit family domain-containing protein [Pseudomonadota bacterium]
MDSIDPKRLEVAAEYKRNPFGPYSEDLQKVLRILHWVPATDRFIYLQPRRGGPWFLARCHGGRGSDLDVYTDCPYDDAAVARWAVFRKRWQLATGELPVVDAEDAVDPARGTVTPSSALARSTLNGYSDRFSVRPGERIEFKVSSDAAGSFDAQIVRLRCGDAENVGFKQSTVESAANGPYPARLQTINPGSFGHVDAPMPDGAVTFGLTLWPTLPGPADQALIGSWDEAAGTGLALGLDASGCLVLRIGDGVEQQRVRSEHPLRTRCWHRVAATVDPANQQVRVAWQALESHATVVGEDRVEEALSCAPANTAPLRFGAWCDLGLQRADGTPWSAGHYNGKLEGPWIHHNAIPADKLDAWLAGREASGASAGAEPPVLAADGWFGCWDFSREQAGTRLVDTSVHARDGCTVNMPTRAMKSAAWDGTAYDWRQRPEHYAAIHFHDDDLHDCGWATDFSFDVPDDLPSGLYAAHLRQGELEDWIPFAVSPPVGSATNGLALLLPTASYWAYANRHLVIDYEGREHVKNTFTAADETALYLHHHTELGLSMYDTHRDGSGVCLSSRLRPVLSLRPHEALWQLPADTHLTDWLEALEFGYDVLTEDDLHEHGVALLEPYRCVMTGTHPEYPSLEMLDAYAAYQAGGGRFMYMGGNGFYWRVSYHCEHVGIMEMRRAEDGIRAWLAEGGEYYHAFTGELGGMWRRMGRAPQSVAGTGMTAQGFDRSTWFAQLPESRDPRAAFIFEGIAADERIGDFGYVGGGAAGWEVDRVDALLGTPPHALVVARADTFSQAYHWMKEELTHTHAAVTGDVCPYVRCDMVFYETANGGAVFAASSIAYAGALAWNDYQNNVSRLTANVVRRFLDPAPFAQ